MRFASAFFALLALSACASVPARQTAADTATPRPVEVMVLGTYHFGNPGLDVVNFEADDVLSDARQAELREISRRLAAFRPTAVAVESRRTRDDVLDPSYPEFTPERLSEVRNEIVQIGYRLAHDLGLERVYAIDEREGEIPFFPFDRVRVFAETHDRTDVVESMIADVQAMATEFGEQQATKPIWDLLAQQNDPDEVESAHQKYYYSLLPLSTREDHAGAALNYGWYARNALIFANLTEVTHPGDRVVLLYGAGHAYWLRHFVEQTPGFEFVDPVPYLRGEVR